MQEVRYRPQVDLGFADSRFSYTVPLNGMFGALEAYDHSRCSPAPLVSWDTVKDIQKRYLKRSSSRPPLKDLRYMAIDEIAVKRGHRYLTVALDLESGAVIFVGDGKGAESA